MTRIPTDDVGSRISESFELQVYMSVFSRVVSCRVLLPRTRVQRVGSRELSKVRPGQGHEQ